MSQLLPDYSKRLNVCSKKLNNLQSEEAVLQEQCTRFRKDQLESKKQEEAATEATIWLVALLQEIQSGAVEWTERVTSELLQHTLGPEYKLRLTAGLDWARPSLTLALLKDDEEFGLRDEVGGGVLDTVSLGLRLAIWAMSKEQSAPVFALDEPGKHLDRGRAVRFAQALTTLANRMALQIIVITHLAELGEVADKTYKVSQENGVSYVEEV